MAYQLHEVLILHKALPSIVLGKEHDGRNSIRRNLLVLTRRGQLVHSPDNRQLTVDRGPGLSCLQSLHLVPFDHALGHMGCPNVVEGSPKRDQTEGQSIARTIVSKRVVPHYIIEQRFHQHSVLLGANELVPRHFSMTLLEQRDGHPFLRAVEPSREAIC